MEYEICSMTKRLRYDFLIEGEHTRISVRSLPIPILEEDKPNFLIQLPDEILENLFSQVDEVSDLRNLYHFFLDLHRIGKQKILSNYGEKKDAILRLMQTELTLRRPNILLVGSEMRKLRLLVSTNWEKNFPSCINPVSTVIKNATVIEACSYFTLFTFIHQEK